MIFELRDASLAAPLYRGMEDTSILSCLQGVMGKVFVTDPVSPRSAMAYVGSFAFYAGEPDRELVMNKPEGFLVMVPQHEGWQAMIEECFPQAERNIRFATRKDTRFNRAKLGEMAAALPEGYAIRRIDAELYDQCAAEPAFNDQVLVFGSKEKYLELGRGMAVVKDGRIVSGASSYSRYNEGIEIEVDTLSEERRKGLASAVCAALILACLDEGLYPSWDAANRSSLGLARKLGYEFSHEYVCYEVE
ncbi:MAG: GNAT family N-acetyltransferase [Clostridia bacterium]|nr:GNAT family N-acetyltransferase [Clostridia bacterium]